MNIDRFNLTTALARTAALLGTQVPPYRLVIGGGCAGLMAGLLAADRATGDCDVYWLEDPERWALLAGASREAALELGLPERWLNRDCSMFAWCLPIGWQSRCVEVGSFGSLEVLRISRQDLIAAKTISAPKRPQDLEDLLAMQPLLTELDAVERHIDRLEAEDLDRREYHSERQIIAILRGVP